MPENNEPYEYGWLCAALLLLSLIPLIIPMADAVPDVKVAAPQHAVARDHSRVMLIIVDGLAYRRAVDYSVFGILPLLGCLSAGNLTMLWWGRFLAGNSQKLTDTLEFAQTEFVLILAWLIIGLWLIVRLMDVLSERLILSRASPGRILGIIPVRWWP